MTNYTPKNTHLQSLTTQFKETMRLQFQDTLNFLLSKELTVHLDYEKYERHGWYVDNSRNGYYTRNLETEFGPIQINVPRDRMGEFFPKLLNKNWKRNDSLENLIITLYSKGDSTREIANIIERLYGHHYTPQTISNITDEVLEYAQKYHIRKITSNYKVIYIDCTFVSIRRGDVYSKEAVYVLLGINETGHKEIIDYIINPTESASMWDEIFKDLIDRGLKAPKLFVSDNLSGINEIISNNFENVDIQTCLVHMSRTILNKVKPDDRLEISEDFKSIRTSNNQIEANKKLVKFNNKWGKLYPRLIRNITKTKNMFTFLKYPKQIQKSIYSTNMIESYMKCIKKVIKTKGSFPGEKSLDKFIFLQVNEYNHNKSIQAHRGFKDLEL